MRGTLRVVLVGACLCGAAMQAGCEGAPASAAPGPDAPQGVEPGPTPRITAVTPLEVKAGATITVSGSGFGDGAGDSALTVGGAAATSIVSWSDTEITAVVPDAALTGAVEARVGGTASGKSPVVVLWDSENPYNVIVGGNAASPMNARLLEDGQGGTFVAWSDLRGGPVRILVQRLNSRGKVLWHSSGVALSTASGGQWFPQLVTDGAGGAIVTWQDHRSGTHDDIYAQRIDRSGTVLWSADVAVCAAAGDQQHPRITSDGAGGAIVLWEDLRSGTGFEVYAQRIDGTGAAKWGTNGVHVAPPAANEYATYPVRPEVAADGAGGAVVAWQDARSGEWFLYAQRLDAAGAEQWTAHGVPVSTAAASFAMEVARPLPDGQGGFIFAWEGAGAWSTPGSDLLAQRLDAGGAPTWGAAGRVVSAASGDQAVPRLATDGAGGAIIAWEDCRVGSAYRDIYAQRVDASGTPLWATDGIAVGAASASQFGPRIITDGKGGAIVTWYDYRSYEVPVEGTLQGVDVYAQRLDGDGVARWGADGAAISTAKLHQRYPEIVSDHAGGAIVVWEDSRTGTQVDLFSQGISFGGRQ